MKKKQAGQVVRRRALRIIQDKKHPLILFALTADELMRVAEVSRVGRDDKGDLIGYQRPEVRKHVQNIQAYLDSNNGKTLFPNALILALSSAATFTQVRGPKVDDGLAEAGTIEIPIPSDGGRKPAWIVDGQQRALALARSKNRQLPVPVSAFIADDVATQREQFLRVNSARPLPRGLVTELLPQVDTVLPPNLAARKVPAALCEVLHRDPESPFHGLIRRTSAAASKRGAVVTDTVVIRMLQESFASPSGCLFSYRNLATGQTDFEDMLRLLYLYWRTVREVFPSGWGKTPTESRLMHGVGIRAMGKLMDRVMGQIDVHQKSAPARVRADLQRVAEHCAWTSGVWKDLDGMRWNELQNVPNHIRMVTNLLIRAHAGRGREAA
jgi:DGQHR domain-containing protein